MRITIPLMFLLLVVACDDDGARKESVDSDSNIDSMLIADEGEKDESDPGDIADQLTVQDETVSETDPVTDDMGPAADETAVDELSDEDAFVVPDEDVDSASNETCTVLFGLPNDKTGLTTEQCQPLCNCEGKYFQPPFYTEDDIAKLLAMVPVNPPAEVTVDPYDTPEAHQPLPGSVCGLFLDDTITNGYRLETFASDTAASAAGAYITHWDACGVCSTLTNLVVYMRNPDLTDPVRQCGIDNMFNKNGNIECLQGLGFDLPCAQIWYYNTQHTQSKCYGKCITAVNDPYHNPDGTLNECLLCDEENSGAVFKSVAGRNRRNTGLPSSMCRPCAEVQPVFHYYW